PYAVLIHRALMSSPEKKMVLADIYDYFREKIPRFKRVKGRGWMNSIRHNLSMNGAFLKQDRPPDDPGKGYIWVLSDEA
ncbi:winged helix DNA-binding domain-containing protein, partial [Morchella conica CCBAS932]